VWFGLTVRVEAGVYALVVRLGEKSAATLAACLALSSKISIMKMHAMRRKRVHITYGSTLKIVLTILLATIIIYSTITVSEASAVASSTTLSVPIDLTQPIGEYTFPWPFSEYKLSVKIRIITYPVLSIRYSSDRDLISSGESVTLQLDASPTTAELKSWLLVRLLKGWEELGAWDVEVPKIPIEIPGIYKTPTIQVPVIPLLGLGIPLTIGLSLRGELATELPLVIRAEGLTPTTYSGVTTKDLLSLRTSFAKIDGVGARLILDRAGLNLEGKLYVGLAIVELPFVKYEFPPLRLSTSAVPSVGKELVKLKTPLTVSISTMKERAALGDSLTFLGRVSPPAAGLKIDLVARKLGGYWFTAISTLTASDGSFTVSWSPWEVGEYEVRAYHAGAEYSTEAWSNTLKVRILKPAEFKVTDLSISPKEIQVGGKVTISVTVMNIGELEGSYTVELKVAGVAVDKRTVTLIGGQSTAVTFEWTGREAGSYELNVAGLKGEVKVVPTAALPAPWIFYVGVAVAIIVVAVTVTVVVRKLRAKS